MMKKLLLLCILIFLVGCSTTRHIKTESTQIITNELEDISSAITSVQFTFSRPDLFCRIDMSAELSDEELELILNGIKQFATIENINEIARSVKWGLEISNIHLDINTDKNPETFEHQYYARYFKTFNASDHTDANIEAYQIWYEEKVN